MYCLYDVKTKEFCGFSDSDDTNIKFEKVTTILPPISKSGFAICFNEQQQIWEYIEDHRGTIVWIDHDNSQIINELGPIPQDRYIERPDRILTKKYLTEMTYNVKANIAYTGINILKDQNTYMLETDNNSLMLIYETINDLQQDQTINWKTYIDDLPQFITLTKQQMITIYTFIKNMISQAFQIENQLNNHYLEMTDKKIAKLKQQTQKKKINQAFSVITKKLQL